MPSSSSCGAHELKKINIEIEFLNQQIYEDRDKINPLKIFPSLKVSFSYTNLIFFLLIYLDN